MIRTWRHRGDCRALAGVVLCLALPSQALLGQREIAGASTADAARETAAVLSRPVTVHVTRVSLERAIDAVAASAKVRVAYKVALLEPYATPVSVAADGVPLGVVFERVLAGTRLRVVGIPGGRLAIVADSDVVPGARQETGTVTGVVVDSATGKPVEGATVTVVGAKIASATRANGTFSIPRVPVGDWQIAVKRLGYRQSTRPVTVTTGETALRFVVVPSATILSGVITTATGTQRKAEIGNDVTTVNVDSVRQLAPVTSVTDVLDGRVPGLVVQRQSGAPGAPARIRIRGIGSVAASNDPIVVVNGVRMFSKQTTDSLNAAYSVLNNIDVSSIERIDVLKGPSASALYGSDAANGVIVITTKRGQAGKTRWSFATDQQRTTHPRTFRDLYRRMGASLFGTPQECLLGALECTSDTLIVVNPLSNPRTTVLGTGVHDEYAANVSGGSPAIQYYVGGRSTHDLGAMKMSGADVAYLERTTGKSVPRWQRRPQSADQLSGTARTTMQVTPALTLDLTSSLNRSTRQSTPLERAIEAYTGVYSGARVFLPQDTSLVQSYILDFRRRISHRDVTQQHGASVAWSPRPWWTVNGDAGVESEARRGRSLLRRGDCHASTNGTAPCTDSAGMLNINHGERNVGTVNLRTSVQVPSRLGFQLTPTFGANYVRQSESDVGLRFTGLPLGGGTPQRSTTGAQTDGTVSVTELLNEPTQFGYFLTTSISLLDQLHTSVGFRSDASNALGKLVRPNYPKLDLSYLLSGAPFFPWKGAIDVLKLRLAYGHAAVQPALGETFRSYRTGSWTSQGTVRPTQLVVTAGNPRLRPERTTELEGGFDLGLVNERVTLSLTGFHKLSHDALAQTTLPLSVGGGDFATNIGSVSNSGTEVTLGVVPIDRPALRWEANALVSRVRNRLVKLALGVDSSMQQLGVTSGSSGAIGGFEYGRRYAEGYPIDGTWMLPVLGYNDLDGNGVLTRDELLYGDSAVYVGSPLPNYEASFNTQLALWRGWVTLAAGFQYQNGMSQANGALLVARNIGTSTLRALNDPSTPLAEQAAVRSGVAALHTVSALRFQSFSLRAAMPSAVTRRVGARAMSIALQGSNLGLWTTYSGSDPNVTSTILGNTTLDLGQLPLPRVWGLNVSLQY